MYAWRRLVLTRLPFVGRSHTDREIAAATLALGRQPRLPSGEAKLSRSERDAARIQALRESGEALGGGAVLLAASTRRRLDCVARIDTGALRPPEPSARGGRGGRSGGRLPGREEMWRMMDRLKAGGSGGSGELAAARAAGDYLERRVGSAQEDEPVVVAPEELMFLDGWAAEPGAADGGALSAGLENPEQRMHRPEPAETAVGAAAMAQPVDGLLQLSPAVAATVAEEEEASGRSDSSSGRSRGDQAMCPPVQVFIRDDHNADKKRKRRTGDDGDGHNVSKKKAARKEKKMRERKRRKKERRDRKEKKKRHQHLPPS